MNALTGWENFYVIVGSSAGALIGLQFVVLALVADRLKEGIYQDAASAYTTPTIVHFATVLLLAGALSAPWQRLLPAAVLLGVVGLAGLTYSVSILRRMRRHTTYKPQFEDWLFHILLPFAAYATLTVSAAAMLRQPGNATCTVAAAFLLLLVVGIHNAWDLVTYHIFTVK